MTAKGGQLSFLLKEPTKSRTRKRIEKAPHTCHVRGCEVRVPPRMLMCALHWKVVPANVRREVWRHFNAAQCSSDPDRPLPTEDWHKAADRALDLVWTMALEQVYRVLVLEGGEIEEGGIRAPLVTGPGMLRRILDKLIGAGTLAREGDTIVVRKDLGT